MRRLTALLLISGVLSACSTDYQPDGYTGGYTDTQLAENVFAVSFSANGYTAPQKAADFVMLRAAELTLAHGNQYFVIENEGNSSTKGFVGSYGGGSVGGGELYYPRQSMRISCFKAKGTDGQTYFDAAFLQQSIKAKYQIK
jgi:hypothetical protein